MLKAVDLPLAGASSNDNDETEAGLIARIEYLAARAACLGFVGDKHGAGQTLRELLPLCRRIGDARIPQLYQTGTEYAVNVERVLAREHRAKARDGANPRRR